MQSESVLIQKIYTHFKKAPGTHKLGVLYVVDSVTRKWLEQAKAQGQPVNSSAQDGTYAAGVHRVTELMPVLMNDILQSAPDEQKVRYLLTNRNLCVVAVTDATSAVLASPCHGEDPLRSQSCIPSNLPPCLPCRKRSRSSSTYGTRARPSRRQCLNPFGRS